MSAHKQGSKAQPFPRRRPEISISPSRAASFAIDCQELYWWFGRPVKGDRTSWAQYYPPDWRVSYAYDMRALREASVHGLDAVEIDIDVWERESGWTPGEWTMWGRLTEDAVQWLAVAHLTDGRRRLHTYLDDDFEPNWGVRVLVDRAFGAAHLERHSAFELNDVPTLLDLVTHGLGMAVLPRFVAIDAPGITCVPLVPAVGPWRLVLARRDRHPLGPAARALLGLILPRTPGEETGGRRGSPASSKV